MDQDEKDNLPGSFVEPSPRAIARQLVGDLWCVGCGYNLKGLSIREVCPECGVPVKATILGVVDPRAHELAPLPRPRLVGLGLYAWTGGIWIAVFAVAVMRASEVLREVLRWAWWPGWAPTLGTLGLVLSAFGAATMIRPHRRVSRWAAARAALGVAAFIPLTLTYSAIYAGLDRSSPSPFLRPEPGEIDRAVLRLGLFVFVCAMIMGLREASRGLAVRSVVVRTGRVDRQSLMALLASFGVAAVGDAMHVAAALWGGGAADLVATLGTVLVAVGSVLIVVGVTNMVLDARRLWPVIVRPGVGLSDVLEDNARRDRRGGV